MSLRVWLPLTGTLENKGLSNITITNNNTTINVNGKIGKCYEFGTNKYIKLIDYANEFLTYNEFSLSVWFKCTARNTSHSGSALISGGNWNRANSLLQFSLGEFNTDHYTKLLVSGSGRWDKGYSYNFYLNTWYHVVLTSGNNAVRAYVNGQLIGDTYAAYKPESLEQTWICIGNGTYSSSFHFLGLMNDVRIYDHCLSPAEIKEISQGLILHYKLDSYFLSSGTNLVTNVTPGGRTTKLTDGRLGVVTSGTNADTYFTINLSESIVSGTTYHFSCDASGISEGQFWNFPLGSQSNSALPCKIYNGHNEFTFTANDIDWGTNRLFMDDANRSDWAHPATFYNFILTKDGTYKVKDSSGYENNGNINNNPTISLETIRYSSSMMFNGVNDSIVVPYNSICPENIFTINLWFKKDSLGSKNYETLFGGPGGFEMDTRAGAASTLSLYMASTRSGKRNLITPLEFGKWFMITMTRNGAKERYYVNGIFQSEIDAKSMPNGIYRIGAWASDKGQNYYGLMSDFRIYCTPLSDEDILSLYQVQARIDDANNLHTYEIKESDLNLLMRLITTGQLIGKEIIENEITRLCEDGIVETNTIIER